MVAQLLKNCEILTYFQNNLTWQSSCNNYLLYTVYQAQSFFTQDAWHGKIVDNNQMGVNPALLYEKIHFS